MDGIAPGSRLTFKVRNLSGLVANFRAYDNRVQNDARRSVRKNAELFLELVHAYVAFDTGRMLRLSKVVYTPSGLGFEGGWAAADFEAEGQPFYPPFVELGTSRMAAQPSLEPAYMEIQGRLQDDLANDMRRSANRARRAR